MEHFFTRFLKMNFFLFCIFADLGQVAINSKMGSVLPAVGLDSVTVMIAIGSGSSIRLIGFSEDGTRTEVGLFSLGVSVDHLFFIGAQLVALSPTGGRQRYSTVYS